MMKVVIWFMVTAYSRTGQGQFLPLLVIRHEFVFVNINPLHNEIATLRSQRQPAVAFSLELVLKFNLADDFIIRLINNLISFQ